MKKNFVLIITMVALLPGICFADDPVPPGLSPNPVFNSTVWSCTPGTNPDGVWVTAFYDPSGAWPVPVIDYTDTFCADNFDTVSYPTVLDWLNNFAPGAYGTWREVTFNISSACNGSDYTTCIDSGDYFSDTPHVFIDEIPPTPTSTPAIVTQDDLLFIFAIALFIFSVPFWDRVLTLQRAKNV